MIPRRNGTDKLVAESERLRQVLLKTAAKLEIFSDELMAEAQQLKDEAGHTEGDDHERSDSAGGTDTGTGPGDGTGQ